MRWQDSRDPRQRPRLQMSGANSARLNEMLEFNVVSDFSSAEFKDAVEIYLEAFPENERQPLDKIKYRVEHEYYSTIIVKRDKAVAGFSLLCPFRDLHFGLLDYIGVEKAQRNLGIGSKLFQKTYELLNGEAPSSILLLEVEDPACGSQTESSMRHRRVQFYERLGARVVPNFRYILPPMAGNSPTDMLLMVYAGGNPVVIDTKSLANIVIAVYGKVYERGEDDRYLCQMLRNLTRSSGIDII